MRVDCEKWIYTTLGDMHTEVSNHAKKVSFENREKLVIEEKIVLEQQLYSDSSSDSDEKIMVQKQQKTLSNRVTRHKIPNDKGLNIKFEIINDVSWNIIYLLEF